MVTYISLLVVLVIFGWPSEGFAQAPSASRLSVRAEHEFDTSSGHDLIAPPAHIVRLRTSTRLHSRLGSQAFIEFDSWHRVLAGAVSVKIDTSTHGELWVTWGREASALPIPESSRAEFGYAHRFH